MLFEKVLVWPEEESTSFIWQVHWGSLRVWAENESIFSVFYKQYEVETILLVVCLDDIVIRGGDLEGISFLESFLHAQLHSNDIVIRRSVRRCGWSGGAGFNGSSLDIYGWRKRRILVIKKKRKWRRKSRKSIGIADSVGEQSEETIWC